MSFQKDTLTVAGLKKLTHDLKEAIHSVTGLEVPLHQVQEIAARQLGEASWHDAHAQAKRVHPNAKPKTEAVSPEWVVWARLNLQKRSAHWHGAFLKEPKENLIRALERGASTQFQAFLVEFDAGVESLLETARALPPDVTTDIQRTRHRVLMKLMESSIEAPEGGPVFAQMWDRLDDTLNPLDRERIVRHAVDHPITFDHLIQRNVPDLADFDDLAFLEMAFGQADGGSEESWALLERMYALNTDPKKAQEMVMLGLDADEETFAKFLHRLVPASERTALLDKVALTLKASGRAVDVLGKASEEAQRLDANTPAPLKNESDAERRKRSRRPR